MSSGTKCFTFNRYDDWKYRSSFIGAHITKENLVFEPNNYCCAFFSQSLDSLEEGTVWHRFRIKIKSCENEKIIVRLFASDLKQVSAILSGQRKNVIFDDFITSEIDTYVKTQIFENIGAVILENPRDSPIFSLKGRYLWMCLEVINYSPKEEVIIEEIKIEFPRTSFLDYLPEIYQTTDNNSFMSRFISIFQNIYLETEEMIDFLPSCFEPKYTNNEFLSWIAKWFSIEDVDIWEKNKLRSLISNAIKIFKIKGTKKSVSMIVEKYTGAKPKIIEKFEINKFEHYLKDKSCFDRLFGANNFFFTVILRSKFIGNEKKFANILSLIKSVSPIGTICNLVSLNEDILLGNHCYLGVNSRISDGCYDFTHSKFSARGGSLVVR
ncbi:MAG: hypothetical protein LBK29_03775 [Oscillospiraceae bacterium]|nr:hypothetical protein [Oscillospiraceae bacterium]